MFCCEGLPIPREQLIEPIDLVVVNAVEHIGQISLRVDAVHLRCSMIVMARAKVSAPVSAPANNQFRRPTPIGLRARSAALLSMATRPSSRNRQSDGHLLVTARLLPWRICLDAGDDFFVIDKAFEEFLPFFG